MPDQEGVPLARDGAQASGHFLHGVEGDGQDQQQAHQRETILGARDRGGGDAARPPYRPA